MIDKNVLLGCIYIPPENAKYASNDAFNDIETEMSDLIEKTKSYVSLVGDLNAKTKLLSDIVILDSKLFEILDDIVDDDVLSYVYNYENLLQNDVPIKRYSTDISVPNNYGYKLIDFCKRNNLYIGNGRLPGKDFLVGEKSCKNVSLIDYILFSSHVFPLFKSFYVSEFNPLFSDVHSSLCFKFHAPVNNFTINSLDDSSNTPTHVPRWIPTKQNQFIESINNDVTMFTTIESLLNELDEKGQGQHTKNTINSVVSKVGELFKNSAKKVFGSEENRDAMRKASKKYKTQMNTKYKKLQHNCEQDLRNTTKPDRKKFWKILNRFRKREKNKNVDITIEQLYEYFRSLNKNDCEDDPDHLNESVHNLDNQVIIDILDCEITGEEICKAIQSLNNDKAPGDDEIVNEF
ncbi:unnamed protein product [Mytilus coruscus]|uniref:Uncharacterized protein n=1 Tax=Mytilus coruscus TaxID=42192 RepID=A0A6J8DG83_MYTCO|nr:unnamed protein product [Mytilus coruscus]